MATNSVAPITPTTAFSGYKQIIAEATGIDKPAAIDWLEDFMRTSIFHSTLDHLSRAELAQGAREAKEALDYLRSPKGSAEFPELYRDVRKLALGPYEGPADPTRSRRRARP